MKRADLSFVATTLLAFVEADQPALAGDLLEERRTGRSTLWFWSQLLGAAAVVVWRQRRSSPTVVRLVTATPYDRPDRTPGLLDPALINLTGTNVRSVGGLSLLVMIVLMTLVMPQTWWLVLIGLTGGVVVGIVLVRRRRDEGLAGPHGRGPLGLAEAAPDAATATDASSRHCPNIAEALGQAL